MALPAVLVMLSLLPLLEAQNPELANITIGEPISNETLSWVSDKWFLIGVASRFPEVRHSIQENQTVFIYLTSNLIKHKMDIQEYHTLGDQCENLTHHLGFQKENGALSLYGEEGGETFAHLIVLKKRGTIMFAFNLKDKNNRALTLWAKKPDFTHDLEEVFEDAVKHVGMDESEIIFVDWKKDRCSEKEKKQLELEKETKKDP